MGSLTNYHLEQIHHSTKELVDLTRELKSLTAELKEIMVSVEKKIQPKIEIQNPSLKDFSLGAW